MDNKRVHFADTYTPSSLSLRLKLGPKEKPTMVLKISIHFENGKLPRIKVKTKKADESRPRSRRQRSREQAGETLPEETQKGGEEGGKAKAGAKDRLARDAEEVRKRARAKRRRYGF